MAVAQPRPDWTPGGGTDALAQWYTQRLQQNPGFQPPAGFSIQNGQVVRTPPSFMNRNPWLYPLMGLGAGAGLSAAAGAGAGAGSAEAGIGGIQSAGGISTAAGEMGTAAGGSSSLAGGGSSLLSGGGGSALMRGIGALAQASPMIGSLFSKGGQNGPTDLNGLFAQSPQLKQLMDLKLQQAQRTDPLHEALTRLSMRLLPNSAR